MTPQRQLWLAEDQATRLAHRLAWARNAPADQAKHLEVARDMLRVLTARMAAL